VRESLPTNAIVFDPLCPRTLKLPAFTKRVQRPWALSPRFSGTHIPAEIPPVWALAKLSCTVAGAESANVILVPT